MSDRVYYSQEAAVQARRDTMRAMGIVAAVGLGLGAAVMMLLKPKKQTPQQKLAHAMSKGMENGREVAQDALKKLASEVADLVDDAHKQIDGIEHRLEELHKMSKKLARS